MQPTQNLFTEKAWEAIVRSQDVAKQAQQQQIESDHMLLALLDQDGLASSIFAKLGVNGQTLRDRTEAFMNGQPQGLGNGLVGVPGQIP
jgi:ATP-dependent Clp protease ATP-binding subunit ClpB